MNKERRKQVNEVIEQIKDLWEQATVIRDELENIRDEEQGCLDNMPENLSGSERYEKIENAIEELGSASDTVDEIISSAEEVQEALERDRIKPLKNKEVCVNGNDTIKRTGSYRNL